MNPIILQVTGGGQVHQAADEFVKLDPSGIGMAFIAITVVFLVLAIIFLLFKGLSNILAWQAKRKVRKTAPQPAGHTEMHETPAEVWAAIGLALHLYNDTQHDLESLKLTIQRASRLYSPWSSKIYTLRQFPRP